MSKKEDSVVIEQVFIQIDQTNVSISQFMGVINLLCAQHPSKTLQKLQASLIGLGEYVFSLLPVSMEGPPRKANLQKVRDALVRYEGSCNFYFLLPGDVLLSCQELIARCTSTKDVKLNQIVAVNNVLPELNRIISGIQAELLPILKKDERRMRGLDLSMNERIKQNVELLRDRLDSALFSDPDMTVGRYYYAPQGMNQSHAVFAVDTLTGVIFIPRHINRLASFITARYEQMEKDAATLDYVFAAPNLRQKQIIALPKEYNVLPLQFIIEHSQLSAEAKEVINETELQLFAPVVELLNDAKKRGMSDEDLANLLKLYRKIG